MKPQILEGSRAIALTIKAIKPTVISAYPITPQTHIVEDLARFKADGEADYEYLRAESEFAAASIVLGASAAGERVYTSTSSQGLLLMVEVLYNMAGMRLPIVITCANRAISAPISIWNDQQDVMAIRDAGFLLFFAENHQEAVAQHIIAYKVAEKIMAPAMVNVDGFVLTHSYEEVALPDEKEVQKFLPAYKPKKGTYLDTSNPRTLGALATPAHYFEIRQEAHDNIVNSKNLICEEYQKYKKIFKNLYKEEKNVLLDTGLLEYYGPAKAEKIIITMGSLAGTAKDAADEANKKAPSGMFAGGKGKVGVLKVRTMRPWPGEEIAEALKKFGAKNVAVVEKDTSLGGTAPMACEVRSSLMNKGLSSVKSFVVGLGGRDINAKTFETILEKTVPGGEENIWLGK
jgi:pyruvate ferredoxin oxidoreductase alpha subunit